MTNDNGTINYEEGGLRRGRKGSIGSVTDMSRALRLERYYIPSSTMIWLTFEKYALAALYSLQ